MILLFKTKVVSLFEKKCQLSLQLSWAQEAKITLSCLALKIAMKTSVANELTLIRSNAGAMLNRVNVDMWFSAL